MRAAIIGGGIGGQALGIALRKEGIDAIIFERSRFSGNIGGGLVLWSNGMAALRGAERCPERLPQRDPRSSGSRS